jgi:hypothetical protein
MDNISDTISKTISEPGEIPSLTSDNSTGSFFDSLKNISLTTWLLIFLILSFLGFNIFIYLAKGTQDITSFFTPLIQKVMGLFVGVTGQVVNVSAEGAKAVVNTSANVADTGLSAVQGVAQQGITPQGAQSKNKGAPIQNTNNNNSPDIAQANTLNRAINSSTSQKQQQNGEDYQADDSSSSIQQGASKAGWCYIGEDRGFRTCSEVGVNDTCMSGDIFPSSQICVNPSLRA